MIVFPIVIGVLCVLAVIVGLCAVLNALFDEGPMDAVIAMIFTVMPLFGAWWAFTEGVSSA
ncbi:hypothetical protein [Streptomyces sp. NPDC004726]